MRQNNQPEEIISNSIVDVVSFDQSPNEGQALSGPFKVPNNILKKQYFYGYCTRDLVINPNITNIIEQKTNFSSIGNNSIQNGIDKNKNEKRKPTVSKNSKPRQQVI